MWILGIICFAGLITSVGRDFRSTSSINEEQVLLDSPAVGKLEITTLSPVKKYYRRQWFKIQPFEALEDDTAYVRNVKVHIVRSTGDSFRVTMLRLANGRTRRTADTLASMIQFSAVQSDSLLVLDKGIAVNKTDKFRNQRVIITVYVPIGKQIKIDESVGWGNDIEIHGPWDDDCNIEMDDVEHGWENGVDYIMKEDGLYTLDGIPADEWKHNRKDRTNSGGIDIRDGKNRVRINENGIQVDEDEDYRYEKERHERAVDSIKTRRDSEMNKVKDSLQKVKDKLEEELKKIDTKKEGATAKATDNFVLPAYNPMMMLINN
jgi:hypothetical protein